MSSFDRSALGPTGPDGVEPKIEAEVQNEAPRAGQKPMYQPVDAAKAAATFAPPQSAARLPAIQNPAKHENHDPAQLARQYRGKGHG